VVIKFNLISLVGVGCCLDARLPVTPLRSRIASADYLTERTRDEVKHTRMIDDTNAGIRQGYEGGGGSSRSAFASYQGYDWIPIAQAPTQKRIGGSVKRKSQGLRIRAIYSESRGAAVG
jgi:hypothetical protein